MMRNHKRGALALVTPEESGRQRAVETKRQTRSAVANRRARRAEEDAKRRLLRPDTANCTARERYSRSALGWLEDVIEELVEPDYISGEVGKTTADIKPLGTIRQRYVDILPVSYFLAGSEARPFRPNDVIRQIARRRA